MSICVTCACGRQTETPETNAGRLGWCPDCGREFTVPKPAPSLDDEFRPIPWKPELSVTSGKAIASLVLGALVVFICFSGVPAIFLGRRALSDIQRSGSRLTGRRMAITGIVLGLIGCLLTPALVLPPIRSAREAAHRAECANNLKQIGLAFQDYHQVYGCLPPAAIADRNGKPLLSWRVAVLPFLSVSPVYAFIHLDEPWDSPHNLALLDKMPYVYTCPSNLPRQPGMTHFVAVIGPDTAFTPDFKPLRYQDFIDGTTNTLLIGESRRGVPWTKPEDLTLDTSVPLTGLGGHYGYPYPDDGFNAVFADGSVRFLKSSIRPSTLDAVLTRNGAQNLGPDSY